jgi:hypothetical protein
MNSNRDLKGGRGKLHVEFEIGKEIKKKNVSFHQFHH